MHGWLNPPQLVSLSASPGQMLKDIFSLYGYTSDKRSVGNIYTYKTKTSPTYVNETYHGAILEGDRKLRKKKQSLIQEGIL